MPTINLPGLGPIDIFGSSTPAAPAEPTKQDTTQRDNYIQQLVAANGGQMGASAPITSPAKDANGKPVLDEHGIQKQNWTGWDTYTFANGASVEASPDGQFRNYKPASTAVQNANKPTQVSANTTDPKIVMMDPKTNQTVTIDNPNYKPGAGTTVSANTTDPNIVTRNPDGTVVWQQNPNYKPPTGTTVSGNTTEPNILTRNADGTITSIPNPNYKAPTPTQVQSNTTDQFITMKGPDGTITQVKNPNYVPPIGSTVAANTTDPNIVTRNPDGTITSTPNPNYQKPSAAVVGAPGTNDQFIIQRDPTTGTISQQPNPNYVPPKPTQLNTTSATPYITTQDAQGNIVNTPNPSYIPTDPGRMTAQLKQQADQQWQTLQQQVASGKLTGDQASTLFNKYWDETIEPVKGDIASAQAKAQSAIDLQQSQGNYYNAQAANLPATLAQNASSDAQKNMISMLPYVTGKGYDQAVAGLMSGMGTGKFPTINPQQLAGAATYSLPNLQEIGRQGAADALAHISPTAAMHQQMPGQPAQPPVGGFDINSMLNLNRYTGGAGQGDLMTPQQLAAMQNTTGQPGGAMVGGPAGGNQNVANGPINYNTNPNAAAPNGPSPANAPANPDWYTQLMARQQQSAAEQAMQAQMFPVPGAPRPTPPGMYNPVWQQQMGGGAGMPATGPVVGNNVGGAGGGLVGAYDAGPGAWGSLWPPYQPTG